MRYSAFEPGDIAACYGTDPVSRVIRCWTGSRLLPTALRMRPSHVAMLCPYNGERVWVESTSRRPHECLVRGETVSGCQVQPPRLRIADYVHAGGHVDLYRINPFYRLRDGEADELAGWLIDYFVRAGAGYDTRGAVLSGTRVYQLSQLFPVADLETVFCSELIAAVLMRLNRINHTNPARYNPARLMRQIVRDGLYQFHKRYSRQSLANVRLARRNAA